MSRRRSLLALLAVAPALLGCPGRLQDPERFAQVDHDASPLPGCALGLDVEKDIFAKRCGTAGCHGGGSRAGGLDLGSPGLPGRLVGIASRCQGKKLVEAALPPAGVLLEKVGTPTCGSRMPLGGTALTGDELDCVRAWVESIVGGGADGGSAPDGGGDVPIEPVADDAPRLDSGSGADAPADAPLAPETSPGPDATAPDGPPACMTQYDAVAAVFCAETATQCEFVGKTMAVKSCRDLCMAQGGRCLDSFSNDTGSCTRLGMGSECDRGDLMDQICICSRGP